MPDTPSQDTLTILIPVFNDWRSLRLLLPQLDFHLQGQRASVLVIDDGSTVPLPDDWEPLDLEHLDGVEVLRLRRNLGHQRAIAVGLSFIESNRPCTSVLVMDGDGEDDPADVPRLLDRLRQQSGDTVVFAERTRRSEGLGFRAGYFAYRLLHRVFTGISVRVGNFSALSFGAVSRLVVVSDLWNHYAASVFKSRIRFTTVPSARAPRLAGESKMNFVSLVVHGLAAISVFAELVGARLLVMLAFLLSLLVGGLGVTVSIRLFTGLAIPGWATMLSGILAILLVQLLTFLTMIVFVVLGGRENAKVLPLRDHDYFILGVERIHQGRRTEGRSSWRSTPTKAAS